MNYDHLSEFFASNGWAILIDVLEGLDRKHLSALRSEFDEEAANRIRYTEDLRRIFVQLAEENGLQHPFKKR